MISTPARKVIAPISSGILRPPWLSGAAFNPVSILGASDDGAFYLHKDYSTLWQESTKTTQVSDVEQYIGYRADLSGKGNHSSVVTSTERPLLSARVNQLSNTIDFSGWLNPNSSLTGNLLIEDVSGSPVSHYLRLTSPTLSGTVVQTAKFKNYSSNRYAVIRPGGIGLGHSYAVFDLVNGTIYTSNGTEYVDCSMTYDPATQYYLCKLYSNYSVAAYYDCWLSNDGTEAPSYIGDGVSGFYVKDVDYRSTDLDHLPYQWVNTATDYDTSDYFPRYPNFDGVDDNLTTTWTNADTSTWTLARSIPGVGAQISTGQTFGSTTPFVDSTNSYAVFLIDRALTAKETADLTYYLNKLAGF